IEYLNDKAVLKNEAQALQERKNQVERSLSQHEHSHTHLKNRAETIANESKTVNATLEEQKLMIENNKRALHDLKTTIDNRLKELDTEQAKWYNINEQITKLTSRKEMLVEMKNNFQGFAYGVKEILQANKRRILNGIIGPVIDLIDV